MFHFPEQFTTFSLLTAFICRKSKSSTAEFLKCNWCFKQLRLAKFPGNRFWNKHLFREDINSKVTLSFRITSTPYLPPLTPFRATWSSYFGRQNSRLERLTKRECYQKEIHSFYWPKKAFLEEGPPPSIRTMPKRKRYFSIDLISSLILPFFSSLMLWIWDL